MSSSRPEMPGVNPFSRTDWHGRFVSLDDTSTQDFKEDDMDELLAAGETPKDWDGQVAGVCRLKDGRYVGWETNWGPTGSGFCQDAYGGDADIYVGATLEVVMWQGLSAEGRRLCGWPETLLEAIGETGKETGAETGPDKSTPFTDALDRSSW